MVMIIYKLEDILYCEFVESPYLIKIGSDMGFFIKSVLNGLYKIG